MIKYIPNCIINLIKNKYFFYIKYIYFMYVSKYISKYISKVIIFYYFYTNYFKQILCTNKISKPSPKEIVIINENKNNIILDGINNYFVYKFESKQNYYYNIKCKLFANNVENIKLVIDNTIKKVVYDMQSINSIFKNNIDEFEFILDNNYFDLNNIYIYLLFYGINIEIKEISFKVMENIGINKKYPMIIFNINTKYIPIYLDVNNILEYQRKINTNDESNYLFA